MAYMRRFAKNPSMVVISILIFLLTFTNVMSRYLLVNLHRDQDANQSSGERI